MGSRSAPDLSVVVSTYEWSSALDAVLRGLADQSDRGFEVVVADDGSMSETAAVVEKWRSTLGRDSCTSCTRTRGSVCRGC
jgi:glycosyltransferase involved in cell wall biosynthesis